MHQWLPHQAANVVWTSCPLDVRSPWSLLGWKYRNCLHQCLLRSTIYWSIACLYEHDLVLLLLVIPHSHVCKSTKRSCCLVVFRILHWNKLAASWTQNVSLQAELTNEKNSRSCHMFLVLWCFLALLGISKAGAMASSKQHQILSKGVPAESSTKRTPSDICIAL
jgi:hypothetical protein